MTSRYALAMKKRGDARDMRAQRGLNNGDSRASVCCLACKVTTDKQVKSETSQPNECNQIALHSPEYVIVSHRPVEYRLLVTRILSLYC